MSGEGKSPKQLMEYRYLGRTGLRVSVLSFGAWVKSISEKKKKNNFLFEISSSR